MDIRLHDSSLSYGELSRLIRDKSLPKEAGESLVKQKRVDPRGIKDSVNLYKATLPNTYMEFVNSAFRNFRLQKRGIDAIFVKYVKTSGGRKLSVTVYVTGSGEMRALYNEFDAVPSAKGLLGSLGRLISEVSSEFGQNICVSIYPVHKKCIKLADTGVMQGGVEQSSAEMGNPDVMESGRCGSGTYIGILDGSAFAKTLIVGM